MSNLKELFPKGKLWDNDKLRRGAGGKIVTYFGLPGGTVISGVPWSYLGNSGIWRYQNANHLKPRSLTDNVSFFRTLPNKPTPQKEVTLKLYAFDNNDTPRTSITLKPKDHIIHCAITHAMPGKCADVDADAYVASRKNTNEHSRFYYQIFENEGESEYPVPEYLRSVRSEPYSQVVEHAKAAIQFEARVENLMGEPQPSTDEGHCECATWS